jgi:hypothetical protein
VSDLAPASKPGRTLAPAAMASLAIGLCGVLVAIGVQLGKDELFATNPDLRLTLPFFAAALVATVAALVRRERRHALAIGGLALATAALALGWILAVAIVAAVAGIVIYVLSEVM